MAQDIDFSGKPTKADREDMKRRARENDDALQDAYESGKEESSTTRAAGGGPSRRLSFSNDAQKIIVITMTITVAVAIVEAIHSPTTNKQAGGNDNPNVQSGGVNVPGPSIASILVGGFVSGGLLLGLSYFLPEFASGLSIIAMSATLLDRGKPFWSIVESTSKMVPIVSSHPVDTTGSLPNLSPGQGGPNLSPGGGPLPGGESTSPVPQPTSTNPAVSA